MLDRDGRMGLVLHVGHVLGVPVLLVVAHVLADFVKQDAAGHSQSIGPTLSMIWGLAYFMLSKCTVLSRASLKPSESLSVMSLRRPWHNTLYWLGQACV